MDPTIIIFVEGGLVQDVYSQPPATYIIVDNDVQQDEEDERVQQLTDPDGDKFLAAVDVGLARDRVDGGYDLEHWLKQIVLRQWMPAPDEAPITTCPWCGAEYNMSDITSEDAGYISEGCPHEGTYPTPCEDCEHFREYCRLPARHKCGRLVRFVV